MRLKSDSRQSQDSRSDMDRPLTISIVAPIYGVEKYISRFSESVLCQTYPHIQYVFVNDGTKDASVEILNDLIDTRFSHLRSRIIIVDKQNGGLPAARKTGMEYVTGDYVWHVDSDDWVEEDAVERIVSRINETGCDILYFDFVKEYADRSKPKYENDYSASDRMLYIRNMYNHKAFGCVWNKCIRRSLYIDNEIYFPKFSYAEDTYLMSQLVGYSSSIAHLKGSLYHYRKDNLQAITKQNRKKRRREYAMNFLDLYEKYRDVPSGENPVEVIFDDILIQAGWYSVFYGLDLFTKYPYLAKAVRKARIRCGSDVWIPAQLLVKIYALFR